MSDLKITDVRVFVPAKDFSLSKAFYESLGWTVTWGDESLALLQVAGQRFYLQNYYAKEWAENFMLHVTVADAQVCYERVASLVESKKFPGVRVREPKQEAYGALVTYVWDPSGVLLHLAQWNGP